MFYVWYMKFLRIISSTNFLYRKRTQLKHHKKDKRFILKKTIKATTKIETKCLKSHIHLRLKFIEW